MKKFSIVIAMLLVVALAVPTFANSFSDVPADHWAYDAINKLVAAGIITGYPDGTYKGQRNLSRYEIAVIVSRALDNIAQERAALADKVDASSSTLSAGEAQDVTAIVKALMKKNKPEAAQGLSDKQADDVANLVEALTFEYKAELKTIGANVDALQTDVEDLQADVAALQAAPKDNVSFSGTVDTYFQIGDYGDNPTATAEALSDGDAVDSDLPTATKGKDYDDFPAEKAFYQDINLNVNANVGDINFDLAVDTITNGFTDYDGITYAGYSKVLGDQGDDSAWKMDTGLLTVSKDTYTFKAGDMNDFDAGSNNFFLDVEDMEGVDFTGPVAGFDVRAFAVGEDADKTNDYYGVTAAKDLGVAKVTGKVYQATVSTSKDYKKLLPNVNDETVTDVAVAVSSDITDSLTVNGEAVYNQLDKADTDDSMFDLGLAYKYSDALSFDVGYETAGKNFNGGKDYYTGVLSDMEENYNYDKYTAGADYVLNSNNTVKFDYALVSNDAADNPEDKNSYTVSLDNTMGAFTNTASVGLTKHNNYQKDNNDVTVISLGTEYAMSDATTITANLVNKSSEDYDFNDYGTDLNYNYLTAGLNHKLSDNISWITNLQYINGDYKDINTGNTQDAEGNFVKTQLSVSF